MDCRPNDGKYPRGNRVSHFALRSGTLSARVFWRRGFVSISHAYVVPGLSPPALPRRISWKIPPADEPIRAIESPCSFPTAGELEGVMYATGLRNYPWNTH